MTWGLSLKEAQRTMEGLKKKHLEKFVQWKKLKKSLHAIKGRRGMSGSSMFVNCLKNRVPGGGN